jgi:branched-chain amino acid transport system ATP-binding protein
MALLGLGHVPQGRGTFPNLTVEENLRVGTTPRRGLFRRAGGAAADLDKWLRLFPVLAQRMHAKAGSLSGGEQQMLAIARAMMARPHLLLLDEPSLGLAPKIAQELMEKLVELNRTERLTVMLVEQNVRLALRISTSGYVLETGQISLSGSAADLIEDDRVRRAYLGL